MRLNPAFAVTAVLAVVACSGDDFGPPIPPPGTPIEIPVLFAAVNGSDSGVSVWLHAELHDSTTDSTYRQSNYLLNGLPPGNDLNWLFARRCRVGCVVRLGVSIRPLGRPAYRGYALPPDTVRLVADTVFVRFRWPDDTTRAVEMLVPPVGTFPQWP